jgi:hypothetical protein
MSRSGIFLTAFSLLIFSFPAFAQKKPEPPKKPQNSKSAQQELENKALKKWLDEASPISLRTKRRQLSKH